MWQRTLQDADRAAGKWWVKALGLALDIAVIAVTAGALVSADQATPWVVAAAILAGVASRIVLPVLLYAVCLPGASFRQRDTARREVLRLREEAAEAAHREADKLARISRLFGTELREIRHRIEIAKSTGPVPHYSTGFRLPAARWDEYDEMLAAVPDLYSVVERAYVAAHHVNVALDMRRTRAEAGVKIGIGPDDGIDDAYEAAGDALDALGEPRGEVWESRSEHAVRVVTEEIAEEFAAKRREIVALLASAIENGQRLFERRVTNDGEMGRWLSDHMSWRIFVEDDKGELKAALPLVDYHRVNDLSGTPDTVPVGEFDYDARHARSRLWIDRRLKNLQAVLRDYRDES